LRPSDGLAGPGHGAGNVFEPRQLFATKPPVHGQGLKRTVGAEHEDDAIRAPQAVYRLVK
jgi:hypothetical protein